jgi:hypothetical protein
MAALGVALAGGLGLLLASPAEAATVAPDRGFGQIQNAGKDQLCMDVKSEDDNNSVDARVQQWNCTGVDEQSWNIVSVSDIYGVPDVYQVHSKRSGQCLDTVQLRWSNPNQITQDTCITAQSEVFSFKTTGEIVSFLSGKCLDTTGSGKGSFVVQAPCNGNVSQRWFW